MSNDQAILSIERAANYRRELSSDIYHTITQSILASGKSSFPYHPSCYRKYTTVKRPREPQPSSELTTKTAHIETRSCSTMPKSDDQGLLKGTCIFCGKARKKRRGKEESRLKISTSDGCESILQCVKYSKNEGLKALVLSGVDLRAKEAEYHKSCRVEFLRETDCQEKTAALNVPRIFHKKAFESIKSYIANEVVLKETPLLITHSLTLYTEEYVTAGGEGGEVEDYAT